MRKENFFLACAMVIVMCVGGCSIAPTHPALSSAELPEAIPVRDFVADRKANGGYQISPDGKKLAWFGVDLVRPAIMVKTLGQPDTKVFPIHPRYFKWSADSKRLLFAADKIGDENTHIYAAAVDGPASGVVDLTPYDMTVAQIVRVVDDGPDIIVIENRRDKKVFDLYKVDTTNGIHTLLETNPGNVAWWGVDRKGNVLARVSQNGERRKLEVKRPDLDEGWKPTAEWSLFDVTSLVEFTEDGKAAWTLSNRGRDKVSLVKLELATGQEELIFAADEVDLDHVAFSKKRQRPRIAHFTPGYPRHEVFDSRIKQRIDAFLGDKHAGFYINSADDEEHLITFSAVTDRGTKFYLYDIDADNMVLLGEDSLSRLETKLSPIQPITFVARDGLKIHGYLTLPATSKPGKLPMVVLVHGGPWARDSWGLRPVSAQFLANRGYAVLQINYRGSSGYGRTFTEKAENEFAGKMHDDLIDGVKWAIDSGIADSEKIGIYGASYGGYAALVGLAFTPDVFACGIDMVGPTDLARLLETAPPYWELGKPWWARYVGDPSNPDDRKRMNAKSPLYKADRIVKPVLILHGVNDPRVKLEQSELMVEALRKFGKQVDYVTFQGDGHGNQKWNNNLTLYRKVEDFFSKCLGGRSSGFDFYQLGSWAF